MQETVSTRNRALSPGTTPLSANFYRDKSVVLIHQAHDIRELGPPEQREVWLDKGRGQVYMGVNVNLGSGEGGLGGGKSGSIMFMNQY